MPKPQSLNIGSFLLLHIENRIALSILEKTGEAPAKTHQLTGGERAKVWRRGRKENVNYLLSERRLFIMEKKMMKNYTEISLDNNGKGYDRFYTNPMAKVFQYEYALYLTMADLFESVRHQSLCIETLKLYYVELPLGKVSSDCEDGSMLENAEKKGGKTQEALIEEIKKMVDRDVIGHVTFPQMNICAADVRVIPEKDGTHSFVFTDEIYGFKLHLDMPKFKGHPVGIKVENYANAIKAGKPQNEGGSDNHMLAVVA